MSGLTLRNLQNYTACGKHGGNANVQG